MVAVLTLGVLASIFGVIPFAQDHGAQQDLAGLRTAEGVSKAKDGAYKSSSGLADAGYFPATEKLATATDTHGTCYVGVSRSGSGKLFVASDSKTTAVELTVAGAPGCITNAQLKALVVTVGGVWPGGAEPEEGFTPVVGNDNVDNDIVRAANALIAVHASPEYLSAYELSLAGDTSGINAVEEAMMNAIAGAGDEQVRFMEIMEVASGEDQTAAGRAFWANPTAETQRAYVTSMRNGFQSAFDSLRA